MVSPENVRLNAMKMDALMEAFEHSFLHFVDLGEGEMDKREKATMAFYAIRDLAQKIVTEMDELSGHMEVCDAILAVNSVRRKENLK